MTFFTSKISDEERLLTDGPQELLLELEYQRIARLERIVAHQKEEIRQHQELMKQYLHINSHNVRGPLVQILGLVSLLKNSIVTEGTEVLLGCLEQAAKSLDEAVHQVNDILSTDQGNR